MQINTRETYIPVLKSEVETAIAIDDSTPLMRGYYVYEITSPTNVIIHSGRLPTESRDDVDYSSYYEVLRTLLIHTYDGYRLADSPEYSNFQAWRYTLSNYKLTTYYTGEVVASICLVYIPSNVLTLTTQSTLPDLARDTPHLFIFANDEYFPIDSTIPFSQQYSFDYIGISGVNYIYGDLINETVVTQERVFQSDQPLSFSMREQVSLLEPILYEEVGYFHGVNHHSKTLLTDLPTYQWVESDSSLLIPPSSALPNGIVVEEFNP